MRFLVVLFLAITLLLSPSAAISRDENKYTIQHNTAELEKLGKELYNFVAELDDLKDGIRTRKKILLGMTDIISKYHCNEDLYIVGRAVAVRPFQNTITNILVILHVFNSNVHGVDMVTMQFDIAAVQEGIPLQMKDSRPKT